MNRVAVREAWMRRRIAGWPKSQSADVQPMTAARACVNSFHVSAVPRTVLREEDLMHMICTRIFLTVSIVLVLGSPVSAQNQTGENSGDVPGRVTPAVEAVATASDALSLASWAREAEDAEAMLVAARMLASVGTLGATPEPESTGTGTGTASVPGAAPSSEALFDEAASLAAGDADILARITAARSVAARGFGGPRSWIRDIPARSNVNYRLAARGGEVWSIAAVGDGSTDVNLDIRDENGALVCRDIAPEARASCRFTPPWGGYFQVQIINLGSVETRVLVLSSQ
jgi:hypothetical protein